MEIDNFIAEDDCWVWQFGPKRESVWLQPLPRVEISLTERQLRIALARKHVVMPAEVSHAQTLAAIALLTRCFDRVTFPSNPLTATPESPLLIDRAAISDAEYWRTQGKECLEIAANGPRLDFVWSCTLTPSDAFEDWGGLGGSSSSGYPINPLNQARHRFGQLAICWVHRLGLGAHSPLKADEIWLTLLRQRAGFEFNERHVEIDGPTAYVVRGFLFDALAQSGSLCSELATRATIAQRGNENTGGATLFVSADEGETPAKQGLPTPGRISINFPVDMPSSPPTFPRRAAWLSKELTNRSLSASQLQGFGGPDHRITKKVLNGEDVQDGTITKIVQALSVKGPPITRDEVPRS